LLRRALTCKVTFRCFSSSWVASLFAFEAAERLTRSLVTLHTLAPRLRPHLLQTRLAQDDPRAATAVLAPVIDGSAPLQNAHLWEARALGLLAPSARRP
jgi:hypothetical protein